MIRLAADRKTSFHTPGHKGGQAVAPRFRGAVGARLFGLDFTLLEEVDALHQPRGVIREAQGLAARAFGADHTWFLVNGTTVGNQAMILATCPPGAPVLIARNAHKSVVAGLVLSGARPVFFAPEADARLPMMLNVTFAEARRAIDANPACRVLLLTSPNYNGVCADLAQIVPYAQARGMIVLVDEAHGPHLGFHPALPGSALQAGADLVVQSTHKILSGMTQASMLHARGGRAPVERISRALRTLQTTSPSYLLMASLDAARMQIATGGARLLGRAIRLAAAARAQIDSIPGLRCPGAADLTGAPALDPGKLTVLVGGLGCSGYAVSDLLNRRYGVQVEMADEASVLAIVTIGDQRRDLRRLVDGLRAIAADIAGHAGHAAGHPGAPAPLPDLPPAPPPALTPREAAFAEPEELPLLEAAGRVSAGIVTVYPPGVPVLIPGEPVTPEAAAFLHRMRACGAMVDGLSEDGRISVVRDLR